MSTLHARRGRPPAFESDRRARAFAALVATDYASTNDPAGAVFRFRAHAAEARIDERRALDLLGDPEFREQVAAIAEELGSQAA